MQSSSSSLHPAQVTVVLRLFWPANTGVTPGSLDRVISSAQSEYQLGKIASPEEAAIANGTFVCKKVVIVGSEHGSNNALKRLRNLLRPLDWKVDLFDLDTTLCYKGIAPPLHRYQLSIILDYANDKTQRRAGGSAGGIKNFMCRTSKPRPDLLIRLEGQQPSLSRNHFIVTSDNKQSVEGFVQNVNAYIHAGEGSQSTAKPFAKPPVATESKGRITEFTELGWVLGTNGPHSYNWIWNPTLRSITGKNSNSRVPSKGPQPGPYDSKARSSKCRRTTVSCSRLMVNLARYRRLRAREV